MTVIFTHSSNNFLAQAATLLQSVDRFEPQAKKIFFLVDEKEETIDYSRLGSAELVVLDEENVRGYKDMATRYSVMELNSNLKPFLFEYIIRNFPGATTVIYLDADTCLYQPLSRVKNLLKDWDIIVTPHFSTPIPDDGRQPFENAALNYGIFNLGFLAVDPTSTNTKNMLKWWGDRTRNHGFEDIVHGYFVDQLWFNLVPLFFEKLFVLKDHGYNMAPWNLHERVIQSMDDSGEVVLENDEKLVFYHYSSYNFRQPLAVSAKYDRNNFDNTPFLGKLYADYQQRLVTNAIVNLSQYTCRLPVRRPKPVGPVRRMLGPGARFVKRLWQKM